MIERLLDADLSNLHLMLAVAGALLAVYVMQLTHYEAEDLVDPWLVRHARRVAYALTAMALLGSALYQLSHDWRPWPTHVLLTFAIDLTLVIRAVAIWARVRRTGSRRGFNQVPRDLMRRHHRH